METKDIYFENLAKHADDRTIIEMLSINKKYNDPWFFQTVLQRRYPLLLQFKTPNESWRQFYVSMINSIALLQEKYDIPYISDATFNPKKILKVINSKPISGIYNQSLLFAIKIGDLDLVKHLIDAAMKRNQIFSIDDLIGYALQMDNSIILTYLINKRPELLIYFANWVNQQNRV